MSIQNKKEQIINFLYICMIGAIGLFLIKYIIPPCLPFIIAFILSALIYKLANRKNAFFKNYKVVSISLLIILYSLIFFIIFGLINLSINGLRNLSLEIPKIYKNYIQPVLNNNDLSFDWMPIEINDYLNNFIKDLPNQFSNYLKDISNLLVTWVANVLKATPKIFTFVMITLISSFFIVVDYEKISETIISLVPSNFDIYKNKIGTYMKEKLFVVIRSYILIMLITFCELAIGLGILRIKNFIAISALIAFLDILPILGVGGALIPWAIFSFMSNNIMLGIGILVLYIIIVIVRNTVEPKLVGTNLGLHPVVTLMSMYIGASIAGVIGLFGFPIALSCYLYIKNQQ